MKVFLINQAMISVISWYKVTEQASNNTQELHENYLRTPQKAHWQSLPI